MDNALHDLIAELIEELKANTEELRKSNESVSGKNALPRKEPVTIPDFIPEEHQRIILREPDMVERIDFSKHSTCWPWRGRKSGKFPAWTFKSEGGRRMLVKRVIFEWFFGSQVLGDRYLDGETTCGDELCVNPFHTMSATRFKWHLQQSNLSPNQLKFKITEENEFRKSRAERPDPHTPDSPAPDVAKPKKRFLDTVLEDPPSKTSDRQGLHPVVDEEYTDEDGLMITPPGYKPTKH